MSALGPTVTSAPHVSLRQRLPSEGTLTLPAGLCAPIVIVLRPCVHLQPSHRVVARGGTQSAAARDPAGMSRGIGSPFRGVCPAGLIWPRGRTARPRPIALGTAPAVPPTNSTVAASPIALGTAPTVPPSNETFRWLCAPLPLPLSAVTTASLVVIVFALPAQMLADALPARMLAAALAAAFPARVLEDARTVGSECERAVCVRVALAEEGA